MIFHFPIKNPAKGRVFWMERIQESVLVSTLKRRSALLTQLKTRPEKWKQPPDEVALATVTVPIAWLSGDTESLQA